MDYELRKWREQDAFSIALYANNKKIADNLRNVFPFPYALDDAKQYVAMCTGGDEARQCVRAIVVNGEAVGSIGLFLKDDVYCKSAELGYWLGEPFWGNGIVSDAISRICSMAFTQYDIVRIFAEPYADNTGSRRALEKAGFQLEALLKKSVYKNGTFFDSCIYALIR